MANNDVYVVNTQGQMSALDVESGVPRWTTSTHGGRLLAVGAKRIYLNSSDGDLFIVDRATGQTVADPRSTRDRSGVNLREFDLDVTNSLNDRLYFATSSGLVLAIREIGQVRPHLLRDPKAPPFGFIPPEGDSDHAPGRTRPTPADRMRPRPMRTPRPPPSGRCRPSDDPPAPRLAPSIRGARRGRGRETTPLTRRIEGPRPRADEFPTGAKEERMDAVVPIRRALLSVSDKRGLIDLARALAGGRDASPGQRRHPRGARRGGAGGHRDLGVHGPARDPRRPGQDAPSQAPRRHPRPPRRRRGPAPRSRRRASSPSTWSSSTCTPSRRRSRGPASPSRRRSRRSTSAARA